jgi:uncharacterized protein (TIGR03437 family)
MIVMPQIKGTLFGSGTRVLGQSNFTGQQINLIEGKEFDFFGSGSGSGFTVDAGIAIDNSGTTPHYYVADTYNNRVLGFNDIRKIQPGAAADLVIGQPDGANGLCNYPSGDLTLPTPASLCRPKGVLVDSKGNLYVADSGNGRVLRFPAPFTSQTPGQMEQADLVLGQQSFTISVLQAGAATMAAPYGLAFTGTNGLLVSDQQLHRVLYIPFSANGTFTAGTDNGKAATRVFGQPDFVTSTLGATLSKLNSPHHISTDTNGQLYVADSGNNRILIFPDPNNTSTTSGASALLQIPSLNDPQGVYVNPGTGEIWVANTAGGAALRYPKYETLGVNGAATAAVPAVGPLGSGTFAIAVVQDQFGALYMADGNSRVAAYYPGAFFINAASGEVRPLAPGTWASLFGQTATQFGTATQSSTASPLPTNLAGVQVLVNGTAAPMMLVSPNQINFYAGMSVPTSGTADVQVVQTQTGQVLADFPLPLQPQSPAMFLCPTGQTGGVQTPCVLNQDFTLNSQANPAARGSVIQIFATGQGLVPNAPPDGTPAPSSPLLSTPIAPRININGIFTDEYPLQPNDPPGGKFIQFSGLAPAEVGVWQINVQIPLGVVVGKQIPLVILQNGSFSATQGSIGYNTVIAVK